MKTKIIKKCILLLMIVMVGIAKGQEVVTEFSHENGKYFNLHNIVETSDDCLIVECPMFEPFYTPGPDIGNVFYKFSTDGELLDSLFIPLDAIPYRTLFEPVPNQQDVFVYGRMEQEVSDSTTYLRLAFIDKDLNITDETEIDIADTLDMRIITSSDYFFDTNDDLIVSYRSNQKVHVYRIGLDWTVKDRKRLEGLDENTGTVQVRHTGLYGRPSSLYYFLCTRQEGYGTYAPKAYFIDSTFNVFDSHSYPKLVFEGSTILLYNHSEMQEHISPLSDSAYLLVTRGAKTVNPQESVVLAKLDHDHNPIGIRMFTEGTYNISPIWTTVMDDGTIYHSYMTDADAPNRLVLVRLDANLNVLWARYFLEPDMFHWGTCMTVLSDGRVAVGSYRYGENPGSVSVVIVKDNYDGLEERSFLVRPYTYYPNPAKDALHLEYSPDVTPKQIELYDLQGRLVRTQRNGLESLHMEGLASGTYTMRVTLEEGKSYTDKVVKE